MTSNVAAHYSADNDLAGRIAEQLERAGKSLDALTTADLAAVDEFHIRGRKATLEIGGQMNLKGSSRVLDLGSGLGGPARTLAETYGCRVEGIDLTEDFCAAANAMSGWLGLADKVTCRQGDATDLPFDDDSFDAAMTIHVAMNIPDKDKLYREARRAVRPGGRFVAYDVIQGEGGDIYFPVPWAREPSISHLATHDQMMALLDGAGFSIRNTEDSSKESLGWFKEMSDRMAASGPPPVSFQSFFGEVFREMMQNQIRNLAERRIRTITYICE